MREIAASAVQAAVSDAVKKIHFNLQPAVQTALHQVREQEASPLGRQALELLLQNAEMASAQANPLCQDTGSTVLFVEIGQEVAVTGGSLEEALQAGVRQATREGRLRHSLVQHPFRRTNTGDNTPAMIHYQIVLGKGLKIQVMAKGGGCENASSLAMLLPGSSEQAIEEYVLEAVRKNGAASCPPLILGIGLGGSFDTVAVLAKKALLRSLGEASPDPDLAAMEKRLLARINGLGLGPQGWGGSITALAVMIEAAPCHIASLPLAINFDCHSHRVAEVRL